MFRHFSPKCLFLIGVAGASLFSTAQAQDGFVESFQGEASRVIQLKSQIEAEVEETAAAISSRTTRLATNPLAIADPPAPTLAPPLITKPRVAYDEIGSAEPFTPPKPAIKPSDDNGFKPVNSDTFKPVYVAQAPVTQVAPIAPKTTPAIKTTYKKVSTPISAPIRRSEVAPLVTTTISAPEHINVNEVAQVKIDVKNPGKVTAYGVSLVAMLPANVKVESRQGNFVDGQCTFEINSLEPGETRQLLLDIVTSEKRALDIETSLKISSRDRVKVGVRQPHLVIAVDGPSQTNIGSKATHVITVTNTGDGTATNVNLIADIPDSLRLIDKSGFETPKVLRPGEKAQATIVTMPHQAGSTELAFDAEGKSCKAEHALAGLRVMQPELRVAAIGPDMNFIERDGIYTVTIQNPGEVDVNNVKVQFVIPEGVKVTTISRQAEMDAPRRTLTWKFDRVQAQTEQNIQLKAVATNDGEKLCRIRVASDETNEKEVSLKTVIATRAELSIQMQNVGGPVQVGNEATFVVAVENRGSSIANDLEIEVQLPVGMRPANPKDGIVDEDSNSILFADSSLGAGKTREFRFSAVGVEKGEHVVRSSLQSVASKQRIIVENSVFVYEPAQARVSESLQPSIPR